MTGMSAPLGRAANGAGDPQMAATWFRPNIRQPLAFVGVSLVFLYVFQYPLWKSLTSPVTVRYSVEEWIGGYVFLSTSALIFVVAMLAGMAGGPVLVGPPLSRAAAFRQWRPQPPGLTKALLIFVVLFAWSYVMM